MKTVCAITGATGYVGSRLRAALEPEFDVVPITRRAVEGAIVWDMANPSDVADELRQREVKVLVHAAWDFSHANTAKNEQVNVEGSRRLFESARQAGVERIVFLSTISAFEGARSNYGQSKCRAERMTLDLGGAVIRPGLVWGETAGGMFGSLAQQVEKSSIIPMIGTGRYPQYLVHEEDLGAAVLRAAKGDWPCDAPVTVAHAQSWLLRDLILGIARRSGKKVTLVAVPWPAVYAGLKLAELAGLKLSFRSDSVLSLIFQNPSPDLSPADRLQLKRRAYSGPRSTGP